MIVVADTSPLNYLAVTGDLSLLPALFHDVLIPPAVAAELSHDAAPEPSRALVRNPPAWLSVRQPLRATIEAVRSDGARLGAGEIEAIALAKDVHADLLLMDERPATKVARDRHRLRVTGLLGVLKLAAVRDLIDLRAAITRLEGAGCYLPKDTVARLLEEDAS